MSFESRVGEAFAIEAVLDSRDDSRESMAVVSRLIGVRLSQDYAGEMLRRTMMGWPLALMGQGAKKEIRLISAAPSPYTQRRDSYRAGAGILLCLEKLIAEHQLPVEATYYDAAPLLGNVAALKKLVQGAAVVIVGTSVWAQGPSSVSRTFFEAVDTESLAGVSASTWVTSGGAHTGAAMAYESNLTTLRGMGAAVFSFGQKQAVFTTDERTTGEKPGEFTLLDVWFMEGLAKAAIVQALGSGDREAAAAAWAKVKGSPIYYRGLFPKSDQELVERFGPIREAINAAANPRGEGRRRIDAMVRKL